jgi:hypothetical protein
METGGHDSALPEKYTIRRATPPFPEEAVKTKMVSGNTQLRLSIRIEQQFSPSTCGNLAGYLVPRSRFESGAERVFVARRRQNVAFDLAPVAGVATPWKREIRIAINEICCRLAKSRRVQISGQGICQSRRSGSLRSGNARGNLPQWRGGGVKPGNRNYDHGPLTT